MAIHPWAQVHPKAEIGEGVEIGPFTVVEEKVRIGDGTVIHPHVVIHRNTILGRECQVFTGAVLGGPPQDLKYQGEESYLIVGDHTIIREFVTLHRATGEGEATRIGSHAMLMAYCHVGHNCVVGDYVVIANAVGVGGYTVIEEYVMIGGMTGIHQKVRIGKMAMVGGYSRVNRDVPPFMLAEGIPMTIHGLNVVGLRRRGVSAEVREQLHQAYRLLYRSNLNTSQAIQRIRETIPSSPELEYLLTFLENIRQGRAGRQLEGKR